MGKRDEAMGILEEAPLVRLTVDEWLGKTLVRLLAAPFCGGHEPMDPRASDQWGEELPLLLTNDDPTNGLRRCGGPLSPRIAAALEARWPPPEGAVFLAAPLPPRYDVDRMSG